MSPRLSSEIVDAVAEAKDVEPTELDYALHEYIDTTAVNRLAGHDDASWTLSFELPETEVTVTDGGAILVDGDRVSEWC